MYLESFALFYNALHINFVAAHNPFPYVIFVFFVICQSVLSEL